ncbi:MAG: hypothetical protein RLZZ416_64 [Candidatus Parcubacteria bacterium]|jgi:hypothetical protein
MQNTLRKAAAVATAAVTSMGAFAIATPAFAAINSTHITITTTNRGTINNLTGADSHTGGNVALGSEGGAGGAGGNVDGGTGSENNGGASAGNGGNGGAGGAGGFIATGNASADAGTSNDLNDTDVGVETTCDCGDLNSVTVDLTTDNEDPNNTINNLTGARARSGDNVALGSLGGAGNSGGTVTADGSENNGGAKAGTGGTGGAGGLGGEIHTGAASSTSGTINMLNTTMVRVRL